MLNANQRFSHVTVQEWKTEMNKRIKCKIVCYYAKTSQLHPTYWGSAIMFIPKMSAPKMSFPIMLTFQNA